MSKSSQVDSPFSNFTQNALSYRNLAGISRQQFYSCPSLRFKSTTMSRKKKMKEDRKDKIGSRPYIHIFLRLQSSTSDSACLDGSKEVFICLKRKLRLMRIVERAKRKYTTCVARQLRSDLILNSGCALIVRFSVAWTGVQSN